MNLAHQFDFSCGCGWNQTLPCVGVFGCPPVPCCTVPCQGRNGRPILPLTCLDAAHRGNVFSIILDESLRDQKSSWRPFQPCLDGETQGFSASHLYCELFAKWLALMAWWLVHWLQSFHCHLCASGHLMALVASSLVLELILLHNPRAEHFSKE
jgi:hypothetical protein